MQPEGTKNARFFYAPSAACHWACWPPILVDPVRTLPSMSSDYVLPVAQPFIVFCRGARCPWFRQVTSSLVVCRIKRFDAVFHYEQTESPKFSFTEGASRSRSDELGCINELDSRVQYNDLLILLT